MVRSSPNPFTLARGLARTRCWRPFSSALWRVNALVLAKRVAVRPPLLLIKRIIGQTGFHSTETAGPDWRLYRDRRPGVRHFPSSAGKVVAESLHHLTQQDICLWSRGRGTRYFGADGRNRLVVQPFRLIPVLEHC